MISIFTAAYNRAYHLKNLYISLCNQSCRDFEWIIGDDGSTDDSEELVQSFIKENKISIQYFKQLNQGKHVAFNKGVSVAKGELFFFVDSDDTITIDAIEFLKKEFEKIENDESFAGISGTRIYKNGDRIGGNLKFEFIDTTTLYFRFKIRVKGDMAEAYKTKVLKQYPFPYIENEKFCPEAYVWNQVAQKYKLRFYNKGIYVCEYLPDGLTSKIIKIRMESPITSQLYYSDLFGMKIPFWEKIKAAINFWRFTFCSPKTFFSSLRMISPLTLPVIPIAYFMHLRDLGQ